jgi:hypothetical protein
MIFLLIDAGFDLPALMITADEIKGGGELRIEQGGHQSMQLVRIGVVTENGPESPALCKAGMNGRSFFGEGAGAGST